MRYNKKRNAYIKGYENISSLDKAILEGDKSEKWVADWETKGIKNVDSTNQIIRDGMYTSVENNFRYSLDSLFDDPTYLIYNLKFDFSNSPLFNFDYDFQTIQNETALKFIKSYKSLPDISRRESIYYQFVESFKSLFKSVETEYNYTKSYYLEKIAGLDKMSDKIIKYEGGFAKNDGNKITLTLTEDVTLRSTFLAELYNNLCYSYKEQRYVIPDNCLRFDLIIEITDIRVFKDIKENGNGGLETKINTNPPKIIYNLHDCNFNFFKAQPFGDEIVVGGFVGASSSPAKMSFDIKYKSISKEFSSNIIGGFIHNKLADLGKSKKFSMADFFKYDISSENKESVFISEEQQTEEEKVSPDSAEKNTNISQEVNQERVKNMLSGTLSPHFTDANGTNISMFLNGTEWTQLRDREYYDAVRADKMSDGSGLPHVHTNDGLGINVAVYKDGDMWAPQEDNPRHVISNDGIIHDHSGTFDSVGYIGSDNLMEKNGIGVDIKNAIGKGIKGYKKQLIGKFNDIRGSLINETIKQIRETINMPKIYPDNVYSADFRTLSLTSFAKGLGTDILNNLENGVRGTIQ